MQCTAGWRTAGTAVRIYPSSGYVAAVAYVAGVCQLPMLSHETSIDVRVSYRIAQCCLVKIAEKIPEIYSNLSRNLLIT